jgi:hypothetical protein
VPRADSRSRDKGLAAGAGRLVPQNGFWEGTIKLFMRADRPPIGVALSR